MTNQNSEKIGVVLFNLGGPHNLKAVEPFLTNLFLDPDIFTFPFASLVRKPLAKFIARRRAPKSSVYFEYMGGKSPIIDLTLSQAVAVEKKLKDHFKLNVKVLVAMRYWYPNTQNALSILKREKIKKVILLPLYPHYSYTTTRSSFKEWEKQCQIQGIQFNHQAFIQSYHKHPLYIEAMVKRIEEGLERFPKEEQAKVHLLFSAHGIPIKEIKLGDVYENQIIECKSKILEALKLPNSHSLSYQSKVGPLKWLTPNTVDCLKTIIQDENKKYILAIPISFVSDHSETLYELKKMYGELALSLGAIQYELMPALNCQSHFIDALSELVFTEYQKINA